MHGIIEIDRENIVGTGRDLSNHARVISHEKAGRDLSLQHQKIKSLSELMGAYKTTTSKLIRLAGLPDFAWQRSFHDHIIRHNSAYRHIRNYIQENPAKWQDDMFYLPEK